MRSAGSGEELAIRQTWKGLVIGGLTGASVGVAMEIFSEQNLRRAARASAAAAARLARAGAGRAAR